MPPLHSFIWGDPLLLWMIINLLLLGFIVMVMPFHYSPQLLPVPGPELIFVVIHSCAQELFYNILVGCTRCCNFCLLIHIHSAIDGPWLTPCWLLDQSYTHTANTSHILFRLLSNKDLDRTMSNRRCCFNEMVFHWLLGRRHFAPLVCNTAQWVGNSPDFS